MIVVAMMPPKKKLLHSSEGVFRDINQKTQRIIKRMDVKDFDDDLGADMFTKEFFSLVAKSSPVVQARHRLKQTN